MFSDILQLISNIIPVSQELESALKEKIVIEIYPKNKLLLKKGQIANHLYFVCKGMVRAYYTTTFGKQVTRMFLQEKEIVISALSFLEREPSLEYLETLEECELAIIHYDDLMQLYSGFLEMNIVGRLLIGKYYCKSEKSMMRLRSLTTKQKYDLLITTSPDIFDRVSLKYIASYLGMSVQNISRIRSLK